MAVTLAQHNKTGHTTVDFLLQIRKERERKKERERERERETKAVFSLRKKNFTSTLTSAP